MRVVFAGSPDIAVPSLAAIAKEHDIVAVLTNPPSAKGRKGTILPTPVGDAARNLCGQSNTFPILEPEKLDQNVRDVIASCCPDILVCFAYGKIFGPKFMALFPHGGINMHPSLLPQYRGATPIPSAILGQETETGFTVQTIAADMDAGDIILQEHFALSGRETTETLSGVAAQHGAELLTQALRSIENGAAVFTPQCHENATYCQKITKDMGCINWSLSAAAIDAAIRAYTPWPGCFTNVADESGNCKTLIIHEAERAVLPDDILSAGISCPGTVVAADRQHGILVATGNGVLRLNVLQWQTKKAVDWKSFLNGTQNFCGVKLGNFYR